WYTLLVGLLALAALVLHGANYIAVKTEGDLNARARRIARRAWLATVVLTALATAATFSLRPTLLASFAERPWGVVLPAVAVGGLLAVGLARARGSDGRSLGASGAYLAGMLASTAFAVYPDVLPAVDPANSLTVSNAAAPPYGLVVGLAWWII